MEHLRTFDEACSKLNPAQKQAVDTVEGPVLVIAGPGTGKTHILTLRIANILRTTDAKPDSILVLTFTDSAARTVRKRLAALIGEETARKVGTYTFHSFAQEIMTQHPEAFPQYTDRRQMGEVEHILLWRSVLEQARETRLRAPKSPFHYLSDLKSLEDDMTRECLSLEEYRAWLSEEAKRIENDPAFRYVRGGKGGAAGELNPKGRERLDRLLKGHEAAALIEAYRAEKDARGVYSFTDTLRIAVDGIQNDEALRADLQEQYQYVLADEHQDANALQHALLDALAFDDYPNLFIVGDEKQAVFGFQGADTTHFKTFLELYPRTETIALTENYRSYQGLLDLSHTLLADLPSSTGGHAELTAARGAGGAAHLLAAPDPLAERDQVASLIECAITEGVPPHEIAVITLKNKTADLFALHLRARGIPTLRAGDIDLDGRPSVRFLLAFMHAVADASDTVYLREALLAPWWKEPLAKRALFLRQTRDNELVDALAAAFPAIAALIDSLRTEAMSIPPLNLFSRLLSDSGARDYFLSNGERIAEDVPLVRQLIMHIEDIVGRDPNRFFGEVMEDFAKAREHEIGSIKTSLTSREGQVTVITAHKAKGMEWTRVFVTALSAREWEGRGRSALIPSPFDTAREKEEIIRLFYVALTRTRDELVLSYPVASGDGKELAPMSLLPGGLPNVDVEANPIPLLHATISAPALVRELTERYLTHDGLSPSAYNEYLSSPSTFFAKRVLRLKEPENRAIVVGNAVHAAIAAYLRLSDAPEDERAGRAHAELSRSIARSLLPRGETFDQLVRHARASLDAYLATAPVREVVAIEETFSVARTVSGVEVLLRGKTDAVFKTDAGECIVDFKTSSSIDAKKKDAFARQLAFYDLLLRENGHETTDGLIIQVGDDAVSEHAIPLTDAARAEFAATLDSVLGELLTGTWRTGDASPYDALLALFAE